MPQKIKLEDGTEQEVFTPEEVAAKAKEEADRVAQEKQAEIDAMVAEKQDLEEKLLKEKDKEKNFGNVRKQLEEKDKNTEELKKQIEEINQKLNVVATQPINEVKNDFIKNKVGEKKEDQELFEHYFKRLGAEAKTKEEVQKACEEALTLATKGQYQASNDAQVFMSGPSQNYREQKPNQKGETHKVLANIMGNTEEDIKKYGNH